MIAKKVFYEDKHLENERLELTDKGTLYFLGRNLTLKNCTLVLKVAASNLFIRDVRFIDCAFEVKQELKNHQQWIRASLKGCRFKGRLSGCDFGHWPEYGKEPEYQLGAIEDCDFSEARLDGCRFHGCDLRTLRLPRWPCFTFLYPVRKSSELSTVQWPGSIGPVVIEDLARYPPSTTALTWFAPDFAKRSGCTPEEIKAVIEQLDCIVY
ncbi:MAG TPA: pentapeptide repeat-containing protein [Archangium sp.]|nr:pentapeptide repeat-containing protein [Archangium sp.]